MEVVIKIDEERYNQIKRCADEFLASRLERAVKNGIPLPKGHGDLIDVDDIKVIELEDGLHIIRHEKGDDIDVYIDATTIIEADKEE